ncbi:hypothetical protein H7097_02725 [Aeromicrobium sp.]|nr:hypothetical protein [Candidatus Saccharibacteria bacterium]
MEENMPLATKLTKSKQRKFLDILIGALIVLICIVLAKSLYAQISLKNEVKDATSLTNQVLNDIRKQNGTAVQKLGNKTFQTQNTAANLSSQFKEAATYTSGTPTIDRQTVTNANGVQAVSIIYKFPKPVFYLRVIVVKDKGADAFRLANLKANSGNKPLLDNKY